VRCDVGSAGAIMPRSNRGLDVIYEIRNYSYEPTRLEAYEVWARDKAMPCLKRNLPGGIASYLRIECKFTESLT
jgi:hypothetical protein